MIFHRGFSAWITCEGRELIEYETRVDATANKVICWIPSQEGKPFVVHWRDHGSMVDTATYITLDGFVVPGQFLLGDGEAKREGVRVGDNVERPFIFQPIDPRTERTPIANPTKAQEIGTILVRIKRVKRTELCPSNQPQKPPAVNRGRRAVGEPAVGFGSERQTHQRFEQTWKLEPYLPGERGSYVTFAFRYRSRDFLISQGIMSETDPEFRSNTTLIRQDSLPGSSLPASPMDMSPVGLVGHTPHLTPSPTRPRIVERTVSLGSSPYIYESPAASGSNASGSMRRPMCEESGMPGPYRWFNLSQNDVG